MKEKVYFHLLLLLYQKEHDILTVSSLVFLEQSRGWVGIKRERKERDFDRETCSSIIEENHPGKSYGTETTFVGRAFLLIYFFFRNKSLKTAKIFWEERRGGEDEEDVREKKKQSKGSQSLPREGGEEVAGKK